MSSTPQPSPEIRTSASQTRSSNVLKNAAGDFVCDCGKTFSRIENLTRHARNHNASQTWTCTQCNKVFVRPDLYKRHLKVHQKKSLDRESQPSLERQDSMPPPSIPSKRSLAINEESRLSTEKTNRARRLAELYSNRDSDDSQETDDFERPVSKRPRSYRDETIMDRPRRNLEEELPFQNTSRTPDIASHSNPFEEPDTRTLDGDGLSDTLPKSAVDHHTDQFIRASSGPSWMVSQPIEALTTLANTAVGTQPPFHINIPIAVNPNNTVGDGPFLSERTSALRDTVQEELSDRFLVTQDRHAETSRMANRDIFRTDLGQRSDVLVEHGGGTGSLSPPPAGSGSEYAQPTANMHMQASGFNLQQTMVWDALGQFGNGDALDWDDGMHWILGDATKYLGWLTDPTQQNPAASFDIQQQAVLNPDLGHVGPTDTLTPQSDNNDVDPAMLSYFLSEISELRPNNMASTSADKQCHDPQIPAHNRSTGWINPIHAATGPSGSVSATRANSPRGGLFSRAGSQIPEETAEDRWPMNWQPAGRAFTLGASRYVDEVLRESDIESNLRVWSRYWIDERMCKTIANSFALAKAMPGPDVSQFVMPGSIYTVNHFISLYFENFHEQLPILHLPTFDPAQSPPLLVAAIICLGACYSDRSGARTFAVEMIEVLRKTLNALFEHDSTNLRSASLIHVYLLVMLSGLLIGNKRTYELAEASRGTLINLCRRADLLGSVATHDNTRRGASSDERWKNWAALESRKRLGVAISLIDTIFPAVLDIPAYHSHGEMLKTALPCDEVFFTAPSAKSWTNLLGSSSSPPSPFFVMALSALLTPIYVEEHNRIQPIRCLNPFAALVMVSALHHHIYEFRSQLSTYVSVGLPVPMYRPGSEERLRDGFEGRKQWLKESLESWRKEYYDSYPESPMMNNARALYHLGHVSLSVYVHSLYMATGKRGKQAAIDVLEELQTWAPTEDAVHAVEHSLGILKVLSHAKRTSPYYPLCVFAAVLCIWAFVKHLPSSNRRHEHFALLEDIRTWLTPSAGTNLAQDRHIRKRILQKGAKLLAETKAWRIGSAFALVLAKEAEMDSNRTNAS